MAKRFKHITVTDEARLLSCKLISSNHPCFSNLFIITDIALSHVILCLKKKLISSRGPLVCLVIDIVGSRIVALLADMLLPLQQPTFTGMQHTQMSRAGTLKSKGHRCCRFHCAKLIKRQTLQPHLLQLQITWGTFRFKVSAFTNDDAKRCRIS